MAERTSTYAENGSVAAPTMGARRRSPLLLRRINEVMREGRRGQTEPELIPFFCECQRDDCYEPLWLTTDAYDVRREARGPLILPGHELERPDMEPERAWLRDLRPHAT
jgi:hypothetical protein